MFALTQGGDAMSKAPALWDAIVDYRCWRKVALMPVSLGTADYSSLYPRLYNSRS
jgi:hypothetical protein